MHDQRQVAVEKPFKLVFLDRRQSAAKSADVEGKSRSATHAGFTKLMPYHVVSDSVYHIHAAH